MRFDRDHADLEVDSNFQPDASGIQLRDIERKLISPGLWPRWLSFPN